MDRLNLLRKNEINAPVAIIGLSCRFPQANNINEFWNLLSNGIDAVKEITNERWDMDAYYDDDSTTANKTHQRHAAMLENINDFDPFFFNISPSEAIEMNPSQKLMLELAWESMESSSIPFNDIQGKNVGVYIGSIWSDFEHLRKHKNATVTSHSALGQCANIIANRISFTYGFRGPSLVMDTGCSSSLVAIHLACQSLWDGSSEMAMAGAVNYCLDPDQYVMLTKFGGLSKKGKCSAFDAAADGFVRGEGAGLLLLKKLSDAERDGDKIYAVIRGTALNNNGFNENLPATSVEGQKAVLQAAYEKSGIKPEEVQYIEAHGTGTRLGDPTEARALGEFFGKNRHTQQPLHIGSVKTNIGHLEGAAGIAGLLKVVLAMHHKMLPPNTNFKTPNPDINFSALKIRVQSELGPWPVTGNETLKAGINSFGWGGTNAHTILEEYNNAEKKTEGVKPTKTNFALPISAKSETALKDYINLYINHLKDKLSDNKTDLFDLCAASAINKPTFEYRAMVNGNSREDLLEKLEILKNTESENLSGNIANKGKAVFIFPGQGSQWLGMGKELYETEIIFKNSIYECENEIKKYTNWNLTEQLFADENTSRLNEIDVIQPALFAVQVSLAKLWLSWGVMPEMYIGHSMGEVAAAHIAGCLSLDDAAKIICTRSKLMKTVSGKGGAMAVTELTVAEAEKIIFKYNGKLSVAVSNSPKSTVIAGDLKSIEEVLIELENKKLFGKQVKVDVASHSPQMDPLKDLLREALKGIKPRKNTGRIFSTVLNAEINGEQMDADYWVGNLRGTVQFSGAIQKLLSEKFSFFIEVSPHPVLTSAVSECAEAFNAKSISIPSLLRNKPEREVIYNFFGDLFVKGFNIDWKKFYTNPENIFTSLPGYPFQREKYELEDHSDEKQNGNNKTGKYLLGSELAFAGADKNRYWETEISTGSHSFLKDHLIASNTELPKGILIELALSACNEIWGKGKHLLTNLEFYSPLNIEGSKPATLQTKISIINHNEIKIAVYKKPIKNESWTLLVDAVAFADSNENEILTHPDLKKFMIGKRTDRSMMYEQLNSLGFQYGKYYQATDESWQLNNEIISKITIDERVQKSSTHFNIHPVIVDTVLQQVYAAALSNIDNQKGKTAIISAIGNIKQLHNINIDSELWAHTRFEQININGHITEISANMLVFNPGGNSLLQITGITVKIIDNKILQDNEGEIKKWVYKNTWVEQTFAKTIDSVDNGGYWLILGETSGISNQLIQYYKSEEIKYIHVAYDGLYEQIKSSSFGYEELDFKINYGKKNHYEQLLNYIINQEKKKINGIVHCSSIYRHWDTVECNSEEIIELQKLGSLSLMYLIEGLGALKINEMPRLFVVTNGVQRIGNDLSPVNIVNAPLWGLSKAVANSTQKLICERFDLSFRPTEQEIEILFSEILHSTGKEFEIAIRGNKKYVSRLSNHINNSVEWNAPVLNPNITYVIAGINKLSIQYLEWMFEKGARHFALVSQNGTASHASIEKIKNLKNNGGNFRLLEADSSNYSNLKNAIADIAVHMPEIGGVIYAEGYGENNLIQNKNQGGDYKSWLEFIVKGAWNFHLLTREMKIDTFTLFSSSSALIANEGKQATVSADTFLDSIANYRRQNGLCALSINWGPIKEEKNDNNLNHSENSGFEKCEIDQAFKILDKIYNQAIDQIGIFNFNALECNKNSQSVSQTDYLSLLLNPSVENVKQEDFLGSLLKAVSKESQLASIESQLISQVAKIIKAPVEKIIKSMTFKGLGIDSLMAIQLRNQLEKVFKCKLSVTTFWTMPSISEYAVHLHEVTIKDISEAKEIAKAGGEWLVIPKKIKNPSMRLFCFHDAGGNSSLYNGWEEYMASDVELVCVELPGRGKRINEPSFQDMESLVKNLTAHLMNKIDKPYAFFGHSMGGALLFEVTRELRRLNQPLPVKMFVSSMPWVGSYDRSQVEYTLSHAELINRFPHLSPEKINDEELQEILINILRSDLQLLTKYEFKREDAFEIPLIAIHGEQDPIVHKEQMEKWKEETSSSFKLISRNGGHRYIEHDPAFLSAMISTELIGNDQELVWKDNVAERTITTIN